MNRNHNHRLIATAALNCALKKGDIIKTACQESGCNNPKVVAHHEYGYQRENWLKVIWYCQKHHIKNHVVKYRKIRNELIYKLYLEDKILPEFLILIFGLDYKTIKLIISKTIKEKSL